MMANPMNQPAIELYLSQLPDSENFAALDQEAKDKVVFGSWQTLRRNFGEDILTTEMAALQVLYYLEGKADDFALYRRQGVKSVTTRDVSFSFDTTLGAISPEVIGIIEDIKGGAGDEGPALFGRLI